MSPLPSHTLHLICVDCGVLSEQRDLPCPRCPAPDHFAAARGDVEAARPAPILRSLNQMALAIASGAVFDLCLRLGDLSGDLLPALVALAAGGLAGGLQSIALRSAAPELTWVWSSDRAAAILRGTAAGGLGQRLGLVALVAVSAWVVALHGPGALLLASASGFVFAAALGLLPGGFYFEHLTRAGPQSAPSSISP